MFLSTYKGARSIMGLIYIRTEKNHKKLVKRIIKSMTQICSTAFMDGGVKGLNPSVSMCL